MKLFKFLAAAAMALCLTTTANAGTFDVTATLSASIGVGFVTVTGTGTGASSVGGGIAQVPAITGISISTPIDPPQFGLNKVTVSGGSFGPGTLSGAGGALGLNATANIFAGANPAGSVILSPVGGGGTSMGLLLGIFAATLQGGTWTTAQITVMGTGLAAGTVTVTGGDFRTSNGAGTVIFVAPASVILGAIPVTLPAPAVLTLVYSGGATATPEPGTLVLLGGGLVGLLALGRARRK